MGTGEAVWYSGIVRAGVARGLGVTPLVGVEVAPIVARYAQGAQQGRDRELSRGLLVFDCFCAGFGNF